MHRYIANKNESNLISLMLIIVWRDAGVNTSKKNAQKTFIKTWIFPSITCQRIIVLLKVREVHHKSVNVF